MIKFNKTIILPILLFIIGQINATINIGYGVTIKNDTHQLISAFVESESGKIKLENLIKAGEEKFLASTSGPREIKWKIFDNNEIFVHYKTTKKYSNPHIIIISGNYGEKYQIIEKNGEQIKHPIENAIWQTDVLVKNFTKQPVNIVLGLNSTKAMPKHDNGKPGSGLIGVSSSKPLKPTWTIDNTTYTTKNSYDLIKFINIENNGKEFTIEGRTNNDSEVKIYHGNAFTVEQELNSNITSKKEKQAYGQSATQAQKK